MDYKGILSEKRIPVEPPENIVDANGRAAFGTFTKEFEKMDFLGVKKQSKWLPDSANAFRLTQWEAIEINLKDCILLNGVSDMGIMRIALTVFYDKKKGKVTYWKKNFSKKEGGVAPNLLNGSVTQAVTKDHTMKCVNYFEQGKADVSGEAFHEKAGYIKYDFDLTRVSLPSVVSIPFGENKPLYTQKDLFKAVGRIEVNGQVYESDEESTAIIDDHKGYYPYISHYDWVTTMCKTDIDGERKYFGINLTRNQSVNQTDYNENLIWFEGKTSRLTPVRFEHIDFNKWHIRDVYGMVDIIFDIKDRYHMYLPMHVVRIDYHITFGELSGYVLDEDGKKYSVDGMPAIGEDKSLHF